MYVLWKLQSSSWIEYMGVSEQMKCLCNIVSQKYPLNEGLFEIYLISFG